MMKQINALVIILIGLVVLTGCQTPNKMNVHAPPKSLAAMNNAEVIYEGINRYFSHPEYIQKAVNLDISNIDSKMKSSYHLASLINDYHHENYDMANNHLELIHVDELQPQHQPLYWQYHWQIHHKIGTCPQIVDSLPERLNYLLSSENQKACPGYNDFSATQLKTILRNPNLNWQKQLLSWHTKNPEHWANQMINWSNITNMHTIPEKIAVLIPLSGPNQHIGHSIQKGMNDINNGQVEVLYFDTYPNFKSAYDSATEQNVDALIARMDQETTNDLTLKQIPTLLIDNQSVNNALISSIESQHPYHDEMITMMKKHHHYKMVWLTNATNRKIVSTWPEAIAHHQPLPINHQKIKDYEPSVDGIAIFGSSNEDLELVLDQNKDSNRVIYSSKRAHQIKHPKNNLIAFDNTWALDTPSYHWAPFHNQLSQIQTKSTDTYYTTGIDALLITLYQPILNAVATPVDMAAGVRNYQEKSWKLHLNAYVFENGHWSEIVDKPYKL